jgi:hypothetical protein
VASTDGWLTRQIRDTVTLFKNSYFTFDRRTLGLTRICLGFYLLMDLFRRTGDWNAMFADTGVLPNWLILNRGPNSGFTFVGGFTTSGELAGLWAVIFLTYVCVLVGYRTKVAQVLSLVFVTSMNGRVLLIENGGYVVQNLLLLWTCFMPLGDRFSVDAMRASLRGKRERNADELNDRSDLLEDFRLKPWVGFVGLVICLQIAAVYYFNVVHKTGPDWKKWFTAVHYVMYVDRMVTPLIGQVREYVPFWAYRAMTFAVISSEAALPFCVLLPQVSIFGLDVKKWLRRLAILLMNFLHIGFGSTFVLGPFAWALCVFSILLFSYEDWEVTIRTTRRTHRARTIVVDPGSGAALLACRVLVRMDRFGLLDFAEATTKEERAPGFAVRRPDGSLVSGAAALADAIAALPVGPAFAWLVRYPPFGPLVDLAMRRARGKASRFFGLTTEPAQATPRAPIAFRLKKVGRVLSELACMVMFVGAINQALVELWSTKKWWGDVIKAANDKHGWHLEAQPEYTRVLAHKMRFLQGWFMFSPNPVKDDGTIIVDAITVDGRHVDPFWNQPPNFDLLNAKSFGYNQIWSDCFNRIHSNGNRSYRDSMIGYMRRLPIRTGHPNDALESGEVYWVKDMNPRFGTTKSYAYGKELLFTFGKDGGSRDAPKNP